MLVSFFLFIQRFIPGLRKSTLGFFLKPVYFLHNIWIGLFLGVFKRSDLKDIDDKAYRKRNKYLSYNYNKVYHLWEKNAVEKYFKENGSVLIIAVGAGREAYSLHKSGYKVSPYESNDKLREFGNEFFKHEQIPLIIEGVERNCMPNIDKTFDGIIIGWGAYTHVRGRDVRIKLLKDAGKLLNKDGVILISFWSWRFYNERFKQLNLHQIEKIGNWSARLFRNEPVEFGDVLTPEFTRFFKDEEIVAELKDAGFELLQFDDVQYGNAVARKVN